MIGTSNSERRGHRSFIHALLAVLSVGSLAADSISLNGDARLSGTVRSISQEGVVELVSPMAAEPVLLKGEAVRKVTFSDAAKIGKIPGSRVELVNGDVFPVEIESLDDKELLAVSPVAGKLRIPRPVLKSLMLGIHPNRVIYSGPKSEGDMKAEGRNAENWSFDEGVLSIEGQGRVSKKLEVGEQFIARFTIGWTNHPAVQFYFADPLSPEHQVADRYYFQFTSSGIEIKRESTKGRRFTSIVTLNRRPDQYPGRQLKVEIRLDRASSMLYLFLNDEPEGRFKDPIPEPPVGDGIAFMSNGGNESELRISDVELLEWDHNGDRHRTEDRGDPKTDSLIEKRGDRFGGELISIQPGKDGPLFLFKSDFQDAPIEMPEAEVSTVFFKQTEPVAKPEFHPFALRLRGDGLLRVSTCSFPGEKIEALHPLLGPLTFSRDGVTALERMAEKGGTP